ncbi:hypothetical protein RFI_09596, partial [Reticulomyxa filosa]
KKKKKKKAYKDDMLKLMAETRDDSNLVGWYRSVNHGLYLEENTIAFQYTYQLENPSSICIIYDPFSTTKGRLSVKAIRLTDQFMKFFEGRQYGPSKIAQFGLTSKQVVEELPLKLHNHHLVHAFLFEMQHKIPMKYGLLFLFVCLFVCLFSLSMSFVNKLLYIHIYVLINDDDVMFHSCSFEKLHQTHEYQLLDTLRQLSNAIDDFDIQTNTFRTYHSKSMYNKMAREELLQKHVCYYHLLEEQTKSNTTQHNTVLYCELICLLNCCNHRRRKPNSEKPVD